MNNNTILSGEVSFSTTYVSKIYVNLDKDYIGSLLRKEKKVKNLLEDESVPKDYGTKELSKEKVSVDVLLESLEDLEEVHVIDGAKSRKRGNLIVDEDEISDEDTNKCKK
ncbi:hypothetical protein HAX54_021096 [Datura stramonium]|uniref:Uncharacterized protein n=1 Tax=Datura stramonium TaxID=4076 RepID=A0ABS8UTB9_DATST|nr:hypothetical protein [Datura stramonium]